ncbi:Di-copper centre-containing protein [Penicillium herquei]|nr:Di-copper centre-containing protein [Penicillium herquei]
MPWSYMKSIVVGLAAVSLTGASPVLESFSKHVRGLKGDAVAVKNTCDKLNYRKSWNALTDKEKHEFIEAELCPMSHPPVTGLVENATNVWDEIAHIHIDQGNNIRKSPIFIPDCFSIFLPWHRYYVRMHELALQNLCNYKGAHPYWDELTDYTYGNVRDSPIFDPHTGFGGNGTGSDSCVGDGPFKNIKLHMSNHHARKDSFCLSRDLDQSSFAYGTTSNIEECFGYANYTDAWQCYNGYPHGQGHGAVGGLMKDPIDSCNDPLFFMHHAYLDKLWWEWQMAGYPHRLFDMCGNNTAPDSILAVASLSQPGLDILDYDG